MIQELPMVAEDEARGRVRAVFADIRRVFPYVPLAFRALAIQPAGLDLAWGHARQVCRDPGLLGAVISLEQSATPRLPLIVLPLATLQRPRQDALRAIFSHFAQTMPAQLIAVTSLGLALAEDMTGDPVAPGPATTTAELPPPAFDLMEPDDAADWLRHRFRQVRALLGLPYIEAPWRLLACDRVLLDAVWQGVSHDLDREGFHAQERLTAEAVRDLARALPPATVCSPLALDRGGCGDALPALRRLIGLMAEGLLRHTVLSMAVASAIEQQPLRVA
jgi:hypothetical protein